MSSADLSFGPPPREPPQNSPDVSMNTNRYTDGCGGLQMYFPFMGQLPSNPESMSNVFQAHSKRDVDQFVARAVRPVLLFVYSPRDPEQMQVLRTIFQIVRDRPVFNQVLVVDADEVPEVASIYKTTQRGGPTLVRLIRTHVLRFFEQAWNERCLARFIHSTSKWRNQGFFPNQNLG